MKKICITGGIACGKSLVAKMMRERGWETLDADDVVHELIPAEERKRLAAKVFADKAARKALEERVHPLVEARLDEFLAENGQKRRLVIIPLLFEVHWEEKYDIICAVASDRATQIARMTATRGYSRDEAERRLEAQMPAEDKARLADYAIHNNQGIEELEKEVVRFCAWLEEKIR